MSKKMNWDGIRGRGEMIAIDKADQDIRCKFRDPESKTYRNGNFFIGKKLVPRYRPDRGQVVESGVYFNAVNGKFEIWRDCRKLSEIPWKQSQPHLRKWLSNFTGDRGV